MKITNKYNIHESIVKFVRSDKKIIKNRYSVTEILKPTKEIILTRNHFSELEEDVSECAARLLGTAVHSLIEKYGEETCREQKIEIEFEGCVIVGVLDYVDLINEVITDFKTCKSYKIKAEDFEDWQKQGLLYAWLVWKKYGKIIKTVRFQVIIVDFKEFDMVSPSPFYEYKFEITPFDIEEVEEWLKQRLSILKSEKLIDCTAKEMWKTEDTFAVYKEGGKRALKVCNSKEEAKEYIGTRNDCLIELRQGVCKKCQNYCKIKQFCEQGMRNTVTI